MNTMKSWVVGTSLICVVVLALGAFLLVKPQLDEASEIRSQTEVLAGSNDVLAQEVGVLKEQFSHIDEYRTAIAEARVKLPEQADISEILREIEATAAGTGVTLVTSSPGPSELWVAPEAPADAAAEGETDAEAEAADPEAAESAAVGAAVESAEETGGGPVVDALAGALAQGVMGLEGFYQVPIAVDVVGSYDSVRAFISALQQDTRRFFLAGDMTLTRLEPADATGGRPAVVAGDVEVAMAVGAYVLLPGAGLEAEEVPEDPTAALPSGDRNPFLGGAAAGD
jgi:Tfp pilus assembly protein PilO